MMTYFESQRFDSPAFVVPDSSKGLIMNENRDTSSCGGFPADDSFQGEFLNLVYDCDFVQARFLRTRDNCEPSLLFDSSSYRISRRYIHMPATVVPRLRILLLADFP